MYCKLTNQNLQTYNGFQWTIGEWKETSGKGGLCTKGWLHCYTHPLLAIFLNVIHANIDNPRLFEIEVAGKIQEDYGIKVGFTKMRLTKEILFPKVTNIQRIAFAILCAKEVEINEKWLDWADNWLNNTDRTEKAAADVLVTTSLAANYTAHAVINCATNGYYSTNCATYYAIGVLYVVEYSKLNKPLNLIKLAEKALTFN